ncbi:MAG TPA: hypothetical protein VK787_14015 [Puia sp.]|jgi:hypothetical protein|nr:hypothetical protein [Puia sp.]
MKSKILLTIFSFGFILPKIAFSQNSEKIYFDDKDSVNNYYLAVRPLSGNIKGVQVLFRSFVSPEFVLPETKLHNVASVNNILTVFASLKQTLSADTVSIERINTILKHVAKKFSVDTSKFALGGFEYAGNVVLRYAEFTYQDPSQFYIHPKAVFAINCPVDLIALWHLSEREIKKNYFPGVVGDAKYTLNDFIKRYGSLKDNLQKYIYWSPFYKDAETTGNEQFLKNVPVRLYYDTDINYQLSTRRNSFYDTYIPDGSELINRLLLLGNNDAEFVAAKLPGMRSNGLRSTDSWSIVDEVDCIQWLKRKLDIFDANFYEPVYNLPAPDGWGVERFSFPIEFAQQIPYKGIEDVRFAPGWGDNTSEEYWAYCFLWWLNPDAKIDAASLQEDFKEYYSGLIARNIEPRKIPKEKLFPTVATIKKIKTMDGDVETFSGTINMLDYMKQQPMVLNAVIHKTICASQNHITLFVEVSPQPATHAVWQKMNAIFAEFKCSK